MQTLTLCGADGTVLGIGVANVRPRNWSSDRAGGQRDDIWCHYNGTDAIETIDTVVSCADIIGRI